MEQFGIQSPLIADPNTDFILSLRTDARARQVAPVCALSETEAREILNDSKRSLSAIFVSDKLSEPWSLPVLRAAVSLRPATPLYYMRESVDKGLPESELRGLPIRKIVQKPVSYAEILKIIVTPDLSFNPAQAVEASTPEKEPSARDEDYVPIIATNFIAGTSSFFDVYVKLGGSRYLKILNAGDSFTPDRISSYLKKGVQHFFLRKEAQEHYLRYCDRITTAILKSGSLSPEIKVAQTLNHGQETLSFLKTAGVSEKLIQHSERFVANVVVLLEQINIPSKSVLDKFLGDVATYEHGVATAVIASLLVEPLKFEGVKGVQVIGLASLLSDIGLQNMPEKFKEEDEALLTPEELVMYWTHPTVGAKMLAEIPTIEPTVVQAVEQHHERRSRKGFPSRLGSGGINRVSEIVGISNEFVRLVAAASKNARVNPLLQMERGIYDGFSTPVIEAFRSVFDKKT